MHVNDLKLVKCTVPSEEVTRLKGLGCLRDKTSEDKFNIRVITKNGFLTSEESNVIAEASKKFGNNKVALTTRLTIEIQSVPYSNVDALINFLKEKNIMTGGTGPKVRPIVACKGTTCQYGLIDTYELSKEIHERFYEGYRSVKLPHKYKIGVGGCPNNCIKPELNDVGIIGQRMVSYNLSLCKGCKVCGVENACPIKICSVKEEKLNVDLELCNRCGRCLGKCPFHVADEFEDGYALFIGGRWGKKTAKGQRINKTFLSKEELLLAVEKSILAYKKNGIPGERFADTITRVGFENIEKAIISDDILEKKLSIISK